MALSNRKTIVQSLPTISGRKRVSPLLVKSLAVTIGFFSAASGPQSLRADDGERPENAAAVEEHAEYQGHHEEADRPMRERGRDEMGRRIEEMRARAREFAEQGESDLAEAIERRIGEMTQRQEARQRGEGPRPGGGMQAMPPEARERMADIRRRLEEARREDRQEEVGALERELNTLELRRRQSEMRGGMPGGMGRMHREMHGERHGDGRREIPRDLIEQLETTERRIIEAREQRRQDEAKELERRLVELKREMQRIHLGNVNRPSDRRGPEGDFGHHPGPMAHELMNALRELREEVARLRGEIEMMRRDRERFDGSERGPGMRGPGMRGPEGRGPEGRGPGMQGPGMRGPEGRRPGMRGPDGPRFEGRPDRPRSERPRPDSDRSGPDGDRPEPDGDRPEPDAESLDRERETDESPRD